MRKVCFMIGSRANYASIKTIMFEAQLRGSEIESQIVCFAGAVLDRYGDVATTLAKDGLHVDERITCLIEGESPLAMAKTTGLSLVELASALDRLKPDLVVVVGDRYEVLSACIAASYMNIGVAHTMGGEVSGTIDESIRHAITKLAHIHFPATDESARRIVAMGELKEAVHKVGCPRLDVVRSVLASENESDFDFSKQVFQDGIGDTFDLRDDFLLVSQHPVTTETVNAHEQMLETLKALEMIGLPVIILWPNADAGTADISRALRIWRERSKSSKAIYCVKNYPVEVYMRLMMRTCCLIGNSSSGIREGAFIGTPVVNVGSRQHARERGKNVVDVPHCRESIVSAVALQLKHGRYESDHLYGDGFAARRIMDILTTAIWQQQKTIAI